jgi:hypothetical protein
LRGAGQTWGAADTEVRGCLTTAGPPVQLSVDGLAARDRVLKACVSAAMPLCHWPCFGQRETQQVPPGLSEPDIRPK